MKSIFLFSGFSLLIISAVIGQSKNWQNLDLKADSVFGISTEKAYRELLKDKRPATVIVAIIDNGVDTSHEDLQSVIWTNRKELVGNALDDDHNGYVDDIHGWNFIGTEAGVEDITELARSNKRLYDSLSYTIVPEAYRLGYKKQRSMWREYSAHVDNANGFLAESLATQKMLDSIVHNIGNENPGLADFKIYQPQTADQAKLMTILIHKLPVYRDFSHFKNQEIDKLVDAIQFHLDHGLKWQYDSSGVIFGHSGHFYGNNDICGPSTLLLSSPGPDHGTHVAGIIGAVRNNGIGIQGVADKVQIMPIRVMSFYRELRDFDLANAIRYATDNGAKVINLSFGKPYTRHKKEIDEAVKYAMKKDVLIVHAAGNAGSDNDQEVIYPCAVYADSTGIANAWIEVGASDKRDDSSLLTSFSNYGRRSVDVFAPGVDIYSTLPNSAYASYGGTSMAAPIVSGLAALIREYYPNLTAGQVKTIIMSSVVKRPILESKCVSGGVVNAYNALQLAATYRGQK